MTAIRQVNIGQEMREAYLDYAMSVIVARALPDARDGLKPVHRRILYAMYDMGIRADSPYKKCARVVGEVLGKYHPHGDVAVYDSLVRLAQDFSMRYPLIDGQGNFGSIDGDGPAAMRYTEARMAAMGEELMVDLTMNTVDFGDNFDGSLQEPLVLPASIPNLLVNGASGIAVGMSTNIPPHNLGEVCDALAHMLKNWESLDDVTTSDLMRFIKGPDFPTGGLIYHHIDDADTDEGSLVSAYATGRGKITIRAKVHIEEMGRGKSRIIVSELPYQTNKAALVERIATLVRDGKLEGIADLRDESDRQGMRLAIELQRGAEVGAVLAALFKLTSMQETFGIIMLALVNNEPRLLTLKQALKVYLDHRLEVVRRRSEFELVRAQERAHILEGLLKALGNLDEVIAIIRRSRTPESARNNLIAALKLTQAQAQAILDLQLRRLASLERQKIEQEYKEKRELIAYLEDLLQSPAKMRGVVSDELGTIKSAYNDPRRTVIIDGTAKVTTSAVELLMPQAKTWTTLTTAGKVSRGYDDTPPSVKDDDPDPPRFIMESDTGQIMYLFTPEGQCATIPVQQLPQANSPNEGAPFRDLCGFKDGESIAAALASIPTDGGRNGAKGGAGYLLLATRGGEVKRLRLEDLPGMMANTFKIMDIEAGDQLAWVLITTGADEILLTTATAQAIRFKESDIRPTGVGAGGMRGIKLGEEGDQVVAANVIADGVDADLHLWTISAAGIAKTSPLSEYPTQGRAGSGVQTMKLTPVSKAVAAAAVGSFDQAITILTSKDRAKTVKIGGAPAGRRAFKGDYILTLQDDERVASLISRQTARRPAPVSDPDAEMPDSVSA
jgi:DNA gyrase subunit A